MEKEKNIIGMVNYHLNFEIKKNNSQIRLDKKSDENKENINTENIN